MSSINLSTHFVGKKTKGNEVIKEKMNGNDAVSNTKRSASNSPGKDSKKRSVLGDLTNWKKDTNAKKNLKVPLKPVKVTLGQPILKQKIEVNNKKSETNIKLNLEPSIVVTCPPELKVEDRQYQLRSQEFSFERGTILNSVFIKFEDVSIDDDSIVISDGDVSDYVAIPPGVTNFDEETINDPYSEAKYAKDIFEYYKQREKKFVIEKYLDQQPDMNKSMRAILIDWMVEVQESFELNHETLYLTVKLIDMYLMKNAVPKTMIQLVGATAALIASKYDERLPPLVDDFLYICDDSYSRSELISMECKILRAVDYDLGIPVSYRFLRRYARVSKTNMEILTLARFILETSLMEYDLIDELDSKIAAAALLLALKMKNQGEWTATLQFYSGYKEEELLDLMKHLNKLISPPPNKLVMTIRTKYTHPVFFEVAKIEPLKLD